MRSTITTTALDAAEVNSRIDNRLPTVTSFEASDENGFVRRIWTSERVGQRANISAQAHIVGIVSPIDVANPTANTDVFAASKQSVAQAISDNMVTGGMADGVLNSVDLSHKRPQSHGHVRDEPLGLPLSTRFSCRWTRTASRTLLASSSLGRRSQSRLAGRHRCLTSWIRLLSRLAAWAAGPTPT